MTRKEQILAALYAFVAQRPGLQFCNYGDVSAYRSELRSITRDRHDAETLLRACRRSYCGRLICTVKGGKVSLDYCTGQYFPTEYRRAVCAVAAAALWDHKREHCMPKPTLHHNSETGETLERYNGMRAGDWLRQSFRREYGARLARRWFD